MAHCWPPLGSSLGACCLGTLGLLWSSTAATYQEVVWQSYQAALRQLPAQVARWRAGFAPRDFQEFHPPIEPVAVAGLAAALYEQTREPSHALTAFRWLALYDTLRRLYPEELRHHIPQYAHSVPPVTSFFALPIFCRAYLRIRGALSAVQQAYMQQLIAESADHALHFAEVGAMNRAVLRALGLELAAQACPDRPQAHFWHTTARTLVAESQQSWLLEDAQLYWGIWLHALLLYGECTDSVTWHLPQVPLYVEAALQLLAPFGTVAPFGDTRTPGENAAEFIAAFEWAATRLRRPQYRWAALQIFRRWVMPQAPLPPYRALILWDAARWADTTLLPLPPEPALSWSEDALSKKLVFRTGWDTAATFVLLNYRDVPPFGWRAQTFLQQSLPIEEEKGSHGHSDELSIAWFLHQGALLLTPPGYRDAVPSGPYGAYRAEYFHNRLVVRAAKPSAGQSLWEFLRHAGTHRPVQTTRVDVWDFRSLSYARLWLAEEAAGYVWERLCVFLRPSAQLLVLDIVHFLRDGAFTLAQFWHGGTVLRSGRGWCLLATDSIPGLRGNTAWGLAVLGLGQPGIRDTVISLPRHGVPAAAYVRWLSGWFRAGERVVCATRLLPVPRTVQTPPLSGDSLVVLPTGIGVRLTQGDTSWLFTALWDVRAGSVGDGRRPQYESNLRTLTLGTFATDADFAFLQQTATGIQCGFTYGTFLTANGRQLFQAPPNLFPLQLDGSPPRTARLQWRAWEGTFP
ncbi:MAG: hypothetical protein ABDH31_02565 [Chlorobiota bacterium]